VSKKVIIIDKKHPSFKAFLFENSFNQKLLWLAGIIIVFQYIIFKALYPYAGFLKGDSYKYLEAAYYNNGAALYPVGYSKFLRLFSVFTTSDTTLVAFQYLAIQVTALWLLFTLFFLYSPGKVTKYIMFIFIVLNPVFLYLSNYILSDAIFLALSLAWFVSLLWILRRPTAFLVTLQVLFLILSFTVRYNALYYPLIATIAILLSTQSLTSKLISIGAGFVVVGIFILYTATQYKDLTGILQFNPFAGWQIANNALYAYRHVDSASRKICPPQFIALNNMVCHYFDTSRDDPTKMIRATTLYMWSDGLPLKEFMNQKFRQDSTTEYLSRWASMGPLYSGYGYYIVKNYPVTYIKFYLWPNLANYFSPPVWHLNSYNGGRNTIEPIARQWFRYKSNKVETAFKDLKVEILNFMPSLTAIINILFLFGLTYAIAFSTFKYHKPLSRILILVGSLWAFNFLFSVFSAFIQLRSQLFGITVFFLFATLFADLVIRDLAKKTT
jgi:hypothetical protein